MVVAFDEWHRGMAERLALLSGLLVAVAFAGGTNPLTKSSHPDPTVWRDEAGRWYLTSTSGKVLESADGVAWKPAKFLIETKEETARIRRQYRWTWAPDVVQLDGQWRYYVSYVNCATNSAIAAYAGASARGPSYGIVVARSRTLEGEFVDKEGRSLKEGHATPILTMKKGDRFFGPGHNGEIFTDADGRDWIYYHCHVKGPNPEARPVFRQQIFWAADGWPHFGNDGHPAN